MRQSLPRAAGFTSDDAWQQRSADLIHTLEHIAARIAEAPDTLTKTSRIWNHIARDTRLMPIETGPFGGNPCRSKHIFLKKILPSKIPSEPFSPPCDTKVPAHPPHRHQAIDMNKTLLFTCEIHLRCCTP
jgi:hypothetical protein